VTLTTQEEDNRGPVYLADDFILTSSSLPLSVQCYTNLNLTDTGHRLAWYDANATDINALNDSRRYYTDAAELRFDPLYVSDSGVYVCALVTTSTNSIDTDSVSSNVTGDLALPMLQPSAYYHEHNATLELNVYIMPDYFFVGMVLVCINFTLCALFIICLIYAHAKQKAYERKLLEETEKLQNPAIKELKMYA
jgi:hypothetical protein